jgi:hypothetical protein
VVHPRASRSQDTPAVESYPVDNEGRKVDLTMAFVGTGSLFAKAGFANAATPMPFRAGSLGFLCLRILA